MAEAVAKLNALSDSAPAIELAGEGGPAEPDKALAELEELQARLPQLKAAAARVPELEAALIELQAVKVCSCNA